MAAEAAVEYVRSGMVVGLGTGSTAAHAVAALGRRVRDEGLDIVGIPTSEATRVQAIGEGIRLTDLATTQTIDLTIDGADETDRERRLIKGGGGALLREKIVASASTEMIVIADSAKLVDCLGAFALPVEVIPMAAPLIARRLANRGPEAILRNRAGDKPFRTDEDNLILDWPLGRIDDPEGLARWLSDLPGVVEHGLFLGLCTRVILGRGETVEIV